MYHSRLLIALRTSSKPINKKAVQNRNAQPALFFGNSGTAGIQSKNRPPKNLSEAHQPMIAP
jgi:hypothetical protein